MNRTGKITMSLVASLGFLAMGSADSLAATGPTPTPHPIIVKASEYTDLPTAGSAFSRNDLRPTVATFSKVNIQGDQVVALNGSVDINGTAVPFSLSGTLYRGFTSSRVNGVLTDNSGNFKVMRFEISSDPSEGLYIHHNLRGETVALYLEQKDSRNVTLIEIPAARLLGTSPELSQAS